MITGDQVRAARQRAGLSRPDLAEAVGVSLRTIGNWETGATSPVSHEAVLRDVLGEHVDPRGPLRIERISDVELLAEVARRLGRAQERSAGDAATTSHARGSRAPDALSEAGPTSATDGAGAGATVTPLHDPSKPMTPAEIQQAAAAHGERAPNPGRDAQDAAGEESQDPEEEQ